MLAECLMALSGHLFEGMKATYHYLVLLNALLRQRNTYTWCWPWRPARVRNTQLFGYMMAVYHPPGIRKPSSVFITLAEAITLWHPLRVSAFTRVRTDSNVLFERACLLNQFAENTASFC